MRTISTDLQLLIEPSEWEAVAATLPAQCAEHGYEVASVHAEPISLSCEPDNMLITQYQQQYGALSPSMQLHRVVINGSSDLSLTEATQVVVSALPEGTFWYGTSMDGATTPDVTAACAWSPGQHTHHADDEA